MLLFKIVRIYLLIFTILSLLFGITPAFAAITFTASNPQYSNEEATVDVSISGLTSSSCPNSYCYLQAAFTAPSLIRYFGFTKNHNGQWYEYIGSPDLSYIQSTFFAFLPQNGSWSGQLTLRINPDDADYKDPGTYNIKVWRYTGNSSSAANASDFVTINITGSTPTPILTSSPTPSPTIVPTSTPTPTKTPSPSSTPKKTTTPAPSPAPTISPTLAPRPTSIPTNSKAARIASVAATTATATPSSSPVVEVKNQKQINPFVWIGLIFIFAGIGSIGYIYLKSNGKIPFKFR